MGKGHICIAVVVLVAAGVARLALAPAAFADGPSLPPAPAPAPAPLPPAPPTTPPAPVPGAVQSTTQTATNAVKQVAGTTAQTPATAASTTSQTATSTTQAVAQTQPAAPQPATAATQTVTAATNALVQTTNQTAQAARTTGQVAGGAGVPGATVQTVIATVVDVVQPVSQTARSAAQPVTQAVTTTVLPAVQTATQGVLRNVQAIQPLVPAVTDSAQLAPRPVTQTATPPGRTTAPVLAFAASAPAAPSSSALVRQVGTPAGAALPNVARSTATGAELPAGASPPSQQGAPAATPESATHGNITAAPVPLVGNVSDHSAAARPFARAADPVLPAPAGQPLRPDTTPAATGEVSLTADLTTFGSGAAPSPAMSAPASFTTPMAIRSNLEVRPMPVADGGALRARTAPPPAAAGTRLIAPAATPAGTSTSTGGFGPDTFAALAVLVLAGVAAYTMLQLLAAARCPRAPSYVPLVPPA